MANYKPADLHVSVIDLFSILMPGALLAGAGIVSWGDSHPPAPLQSLLATPPAQWVAFVVSAYSLGHFAFLVAAQLDPFYDRYRRLHWPNRRRDAYAAATRERHLYFGERAPFDARFPPGTEETEAMSAWAAFLRAATPRPLPAALPADDWPMNTFNWSKAMLMIESPAGAALVERYEADSKFFRSLIVVLPIIGVVLGWRMGWWLTILALALAGICFILYAERRQKSTAWAYRFIVVLMQARRNAAAVTPPAE